MFHDDLVQRRLLLALAAYEICVIGVTAWAGANIALSGGGSLAMAAPLLLIAAAESLRIFVAAWATRVSFFPKMLALLVLAAISVASFEGLSLAFEVFLTNRITHITQLQRDLRVAEQRVADANAKQATGRDDVARIDAYPDGSHDPRLTTARHNGDFGFCRRLPGEFPNGNPRWDCRVLHRGVVENAYSANGWLTSPVPAQRPSDDPISQLFN